MGPRDRSRVGPQIVLGMEAERRGESSAAEQWFLGAQRDDPDHPGPALLLVDYAIDRGDLARATTLLRHPALESGGTTLAFLHDIRRELEAPWRAVGRNDPCPCGSGRKFKACCARDPKVALSARTRLLAFKVSQFALADHRRARFVGVASSACDPDDPDLIEQMRSLAQSGVIADFVIWDGGLAEDYLEQRSDFLPADERELLEDILRSPRALWEVVGVDRGSWHDAARHRDRRHGHGGRAHGVASGGSRRTAVEQARPPPRSEPDLGHADHRAVATPRVGPGVDGRAPRRRHARQLVRRRHRVPTNDDARERTASCCATAS